jgi:hypothetical protein
VSEGFFSRWSRRKQEVATRSLPAELDESEPPKVASSEAVQPDAAPVAESSAADVAPPALPSLEDVKNLTPQSDFQPFMQRGVGAEVRNAAMKKLFADPHFNVMDGLDIYIDDYSQPDPLPGGMLRKMASAQFMKLVPEVGAARHPQDPDGSAAPEQAPRVVAQSPDSSASAEHPQHDHTDLQLQPDPAAAGSQPEPGPR